MAETKAPFSAVERLAATGSELWWDSSPLIFAAWKQQMIAENPGLQTPLERMYDSADPARSVLRGVTTNPQLSTAVLRGDPPTWDRWSEEYLRKHPQASARKLFWDLYKEIVRRGAAMFEPVFKASGYREGYLSGQVDPRILTDTETMVAQGRELNGMARNIMIKMPGTKEGIEGIRRLTTMGIPTNATLTFTVSQLLAVAEAVKAGLAEARAKGVDLTRWRSVVTMMLGRMEDAPIFAEQASKLGLDLTETDKRWAGIAVFKKIYRLYRERGYESKELAASMRLGPMIGGQPRIWHLEKLAGMNAILTVFPNIYEGWLRDYADREIVSAENEDAPPAVLEKLLKIPYFREAYDENGIAPEDFIKHPAVVETGKAFADATNEMEAYAAARIKVI